MLVKILSTGSFLGTNVIDNKSLFSKVTNFNKDRALEALIKKGKNIEGLNESELFDLWVRQVCGVEKRYYFSEKPKNDPEGPEQLTEYMGYIAGKKALEKADIVSESIDYVIFVSYTPDQVMPNGGCTLSYYLKINGAPAFHMNTACSGFIDGLGVANMMIKSCECKRILVIAAERMSAFLDFGDVTTAVLFGDGACAAILEPSQDDSGIISFVSNTAYNNNMLSMNNGDVIQMKGGAFVQRNAVNYMASTIEKAFQKAGMTLKDISYVLPHQANLRIIHCLADKLKIPNKKILQSVIFTGNTSSAAIGIGMDLAFDKKIDSLKFKKQDILGLTAVGGGYTSAGMVYRI